MDLFSNQGRWLRFDYYRTREVGQRLYVTPAEGSEYRWYQPLQTKALLIDFLKLASTLTEIDDDRDEALRKAPVTEQEQVQAEYQRMEADKIVLFYRQYGMLGLFWDGVAEYAFTEDLLLLVPKPHRSLFPEGHRLGSGGWVKYPNYAEYFFPGRAIPQLAKHQTLDFNRRYHEDVAWVALACRVVLHKAEMLRRFVESGQGLDGRCGFRGQLTWRKVLENVWYPEPVKLVLGFDGAPTLDYHIRSLLSAVNVQLLQSTAGYGEPYRICALEGCNWPYIPKQPTQKYCCTAHENTDAQRRWRARQKQKRGTSPTKKGTQTEYPQTPVTNSF